MAARTGPRIYRITNVLEGKEYIGLDMNNRKPEQLLQFHRYKADYCRRMYDDMDLPGAKFVCEILEIHDNQTDAEEAHRFYVLLDKPYYNQFEPFRYLYTHEHDKPLHKTGRLR